jgi:hypothetical protein
MGVDNLNSIVLHGGGVISEGGKQSIKARDRDGGAVSIADKIW